MAVDDPAHVGDAGQRVDGPHEERVGVGEQQGAGGVNGVGEVVQLRV